MNFDQLVTLCSDTQRHFVAAAGRTINTHLAARNFLLGLYIVHFEQEGEDRASYGKQTLKALSSALKTAAGRGFSVDNLELMRRFFIHFRSEILHTEISEAPSRISLPDAPQKSETLSRISTEIQRATLPSHKMMETLPNRFPLGWSNPSTTSSAASPSAGPTTSNFSPSNPRTSAASTRSRPLPTNGACASLSARLPAPSTSASPSAGTRKKSAASPPRGRSWKNPPISSRTRSCWSSSVSNKSPTT